jgi:hypothetical protein
MEEVFPILAGVAVGLVAHLIKSIRRKSIMIVVFAVLFGACASWISGELVISFVYLVIDTAQVLGAAVMSMLLASGWMRRQVRRAVR